MNIGLVIFILVAVGILVLTVVSLRKKKQVVSPDTTPIVVDDGDSSPME